MLVHKVIQAERLMTSRTPDGGGVLNISMAGGAFDVALTPEIWLKLEDALRWHNPKLVTNGHVNGVAKTNGVTVVDQEARLSTVEARLCDVEERLKAVEKRVARLES